MYKREIEAKHLRDSINFRAEVAIISRTVPMVDFSCRDLPVPLFYRWKSLAIRFQAWQERDQFLLSRSLHAYTPLPTKKSAKPIYRILNRNLRRIGPRQSFRNVAGLRWKFSVILFLSSFPTEKYRPVRVYHSRYLTRVFRHLSYFNRDLHFFRWNESILLPE